MFGFSWPQASSSWFWELLCSSAWELLLQKKCYLFGFESRKDWFALKRTVCSMHVAPGQTAPVPYPTKLQHLQQRYTVLWCLGVENLESGQEYYPQWNKPASWIMLDYANAQVHWWSFVACCFQLRGQPQRNPCQNQQGESSCIASTSWDSLSIQYAVFTIIH